MGWTARGQALIETALVAPVMLALILGALVVGQLLNSSFTLQHALRAAAEQAALSGGDALSSEQAALAVLAGGIGMSARVITSTGSDASASRATVTVSCAQTPCRRYDEVTVELRYRDTYWVPLGWMALGEDYEMLVRATRLAEQDQP